MAAARSEAELAWSVSGAEGQAWRNQRAGHGPAIIAACGAGEQCGGTHGRWQSGNRGGRGRSVDCPCCDNRSEPLIYELSLFFERIAGFRGVFPFPESTIRRILATRVRTTFEERWFVFFWFTWRSFGPTIGELNNAPGASACCP